MSQLPPLNPSEPLAAALRSPALTIGQNSRGLWVVRDPGGMTGGIFLGRPDAMRFAAWEHGRPRTALLATDSIEFEIPGIAVTPNSPADRPQDATTQGRAHV